MPDADDVQRNVRWYQVILATACGYVDVPINGNHNDSQTRSAFRDFQQSHGLEASGYLTVESNIALNQVALESIYRRSPSRRDRRAMCCGIRSKSSRPTTGWPTMEKSER